jgi:hypothetical protein
MPYSNISIQRNYQRAWMAARRQTALDARGNACQHCQATDRLEFHHRRPEDKVSHRIFSRRWEFIDQELSKCDILCSECHLEHTRPMLRAKALGQPRDEFGNFVRATPVPRIGPTSAPSHAVPSAPEVAVA